MKNALYTLLLVLIPFLGHAQNGVVTVEQDPEITELLEIYKKSIPKLLITQFRLVLDLMPRQPFFKMMLP
ncbi:hypothetical protein [Muriicola soli]|uniref:hypothetical protein n=1 Tax=Muriicola soli TaxID=2507538 RepID=UPI001FE9D35D|nr:hypothetical protein [Muriicola soli]